MNLENYEVTLSSFLIGWLRGANAGRFKSLVIAPWNKQSILYLNRAPIASIKCGVLRVHSLHDSLELKNLAAKLNVPVQTFDDVDFFNNGWLDNKILR